MPGSNEILAVGDEAIAELENSGANNNGTNGNLSTAPEGSENTPEDKNEPAKTEETKTETSSETDGNKPEEEEEVEEDGYYFGDVKVDVEVPSEISEALKEAKIDESKLIKELFNKEGKFELSEATRKSLDKAFGKTMVDGYLNLFKSQNAQAVDSYKKEAAELETTMKANGEDFTKLVGGDEGWSELATWAGESLSEAELAQFNAVMQLPPEHYAAQRAVVEALQIKRQAALQQANGDSRVTLPTDGAAAPERTAAGLPESLTRAQFQDIYTSVRYKTDVAYAAQIDNIRRASQKRGIK